MLAVDWMLDTFRTITLHPEFGSEAFRNGAASIERIGVGYDAVLDHKKTPCQDDRSLYLF